MRRTYVAAGVVLLVLVVGQVVTPWIAGRVARGEIDGRGHVVSAKVSAFPWVKLLFHKADSVTIHMSTLQLGTGSDIGAELDKTRDADRVAVTIDDAVLGPLHLRDIQFEKSGDALSGEASVTEQDLSDATLGLGLRVMPIASGDGALVMRVSAGPLAGDARVATQDGKIRISPDGLLGGFAAVTIFEDPRVDVEGVGARTDAGGFTLTADGILP